MMHGHVSLVEFVGDSARHDSGLPFHFSEYLELVEWTGCIVRSDKRGAIPKTIPPLLNRLGIETENWLETVTHFRHNFFDYVGPAQCTGAVCQYTRAQVVAWRRSLPQIIGKRVETGGGYILICPQTTQPTGEQTITRTGGTIIETKIAPDPRFGMDAPIRTYQKSTRKGVVPNTATTAESVTSFDNLRICVRNSNSPETATTLARKWMAYVD